MRKILLTIFVSGQILIGYAQTNKEKVNDDFFYGTWTDSTKTGMTLTQEKEFLLVPNKAPEPGLEGLDLTKVKWSYNLVLDKTPIVIEITCTHSDEKPIPKKFFGQIEIINSQQIYFITFNQNGEVMDKVRMTKN